MLGTRAGQYKTSLLSPFESEEFHCFRMVRLFSHIPLVTVVWVRKVAVFHRTSCCADMTDVRLAATHLWGVSAGVAKRRCLEMDHSIFTDLSP